MKIGSVTPFILHVPVTGSRIAVEGPLLADRSRPITTVEAALIHT